VSAVELHGIAKAYGHTPVLDDLSLTVGDHSVTAILGPSGSGKTTVLRLIAGFERVDSGTISIGERVVDDRRTHVRPERRGIGYVPQDGALFPHLTAERNVSFGLDRAGPNRVPELLELVGLSGLGHRYPHELSGGQQQRVALARALAIRPALLLLDEPFSSLESSLRVSLRRDMARVLAQTGTPAIIVTHDQDEALTIADRIAILDRGRILAQGGPSELYDAPTNPAAAGYLGDANLLPATIRAGDAETALGVLALRDPAPRSDGPATVLIRPEQLRLHPPTEAGPATGHATARVLAVDFHGHDSVVQVGLADGAILIARIAGAHDVRAGDAVTVEVLGDVLAWAAT